MIISFGFSISFSSQNKNTYYSQMKEFSQVYFSTGEMETVKRGLLIVGEDAESDDEALDLGFNFWAWC